MSHLEYSIDETRINEGCAVLELDGVINPSTVDLFEQGMTALLKFGIDNSCKILQVNLLKLSYINSSGLRVILTTTKTAKTQDIALQFVDAIDEVYKVFEQVGYCRIFDIRKHSG